MNLTDFAGAVFDVTRAGFDNLRKKSLDLIIQALKNSYPKTFSHYLYRTHWTTVGDDADGVSAITAELDQPLRAMKEGLFLLRKALSQSEYRRICRQAFEALQNLLWSELLMRQDFTTLGASRLRQDVSAITSLAGDAEVMGRLHEGITLLNLPLNKEGADGISLMEASNAIFAAAPEADAMLEKLGLRIITKLDARAILQKRRESVV